jgi:hypothetical protein
MRTEENKNLNKLRKVVAVMTKPSLGGITGEKGETQGLVLIVSVKEIQGKIAMEPIRLGGLVKGPRRIYHQEEGPEAPEGLP